MRVKKSNKKLSFAKKRNKITSSSVLNSRFNRRLAFKKLLLSFHPKNLKSKYKYVAIGLTIFIVVPLVYFLNVSAVFDSFGQTTWDGVRTDPLTDPLDTLYTSKDNIITTTHDQLELDASINEDWCDNAPICDDSFVNRKLVTINNAGDAIETPVNIQLNVTYDSLMQADFDDLRFTDMTGANLGYYLSGKTDNTSANIYINMPSLINGDSFIYMYYGNPSANSVSSTDDINKQFEDGFESDELSLSNWVISGNSAEGQVEFASDNNSLILHSVPNYYSLYIRNPENNNLNFDRTKERVFEYSAKMDIISGFSCVYNSNGYNNHYYNGDLNVGSFTVNQSVYNIGYDEHGMNIYTGLCDVNNTPIFRPNYINNNYQYANASSPYFLSGTEYQFKQIYYKTGGKTYWYKIAGDTAWVPLFNTDVNIGTSTDYSYLYFNNYPYSDSALADLTLSDIYAYSYEPTENSFSYSQYNGGATGLLDSSIFNVSDRPYFGKVTFEKSGLGNVNIQIRTDSDQAMATAPDWNDCNYLNDNDDIYNSTCVTKGQRYLQYRILMAGTSSVDPIDKLIFESVNFEFINDNQAPEIDEIIGKKDETNVIINGSWSNAVSPNFSWTAAIDSDPGSGTAGYCLYFGTDDDPDLTTTSGLLQGFDSQINTDTCQFAISGTSFDFMTLTGIEHNLKWKPYDYNYTLIGGYSYSEYIDGSWVGYNVSGASSGDTVYFIVKPFDNAGNISENGSQVNYKLDKDSPDGYSFIEKESAYVKNTPAETITWMYNEDAGLGWYDEDSGLAGMKYCIVDALAGGDFELCDPEEHPENYVGPNLAEYGTDEYMTDVWQPGDLRLTTNPDDPRYAASGLGGGNGAFFVLLGAMDNAGNIDVSDGQNILQKYTTIPSGAPQNLTVDPAEPNSVNSFSFDWDAPAVSDNPFYSEDSAFVLQILEGSRENFSYCWSVNEPINEAGTNCTRTAKGVTELPVGPYATEQGVNTLYIMTINEAGNFMSTYTYTDEETQEEVTISNMAEIEFTADTIAPGIPQNVEVIDVSTLLDPVDTSIWRLALSWTEPNSGVTTVNSYRILRSTDGTNFTEIMSVPADSLSYIDLGLSQMEYYYKVMACDNAGSCGIASNIVSMTPTGRYTTPALLSDGPYVDPISTRKATISWKTNRVSDSKVFLSTTPGIDINNGKYDGGDVTKTTDHNVELSNLQAGTKYYYVATWTDGNGNVGKTDESSFTTLPAPNIAEVNIKNITIDGSTISFSVENAGKLNMYYGKTENFGGVVSINTSTTKSDYSILLNSLDDDSKYFIRLNGFDVDGNEYQGNTYSFTTVARPRISNLRFQPIADASSNTTMVTWTTNVPTSSELSYGIVGGTQLEEIDSKLKTEHEIIISNLTDDKDYNLIARSRDALGNLAVSDVQTFRTALDTRPPKISNITVETTIKGSGSESKGQVIVSWDTDEPSTSQVAYGQGSPGSYSNKTSEDSELVSSHTVVISDLSTSSIYQIQPISKDKADNEADGTNQSAIIGRGSEDVLTIIFNALRNIFGIKA